MMRNSEVNNGRCPQAWHAGIYAGLLHECKYTAGHRGWHRNADGSLFWGGKLTVLEREMATSLRDHARAAIDDQEGVT